MVGDQFIQFQCEPCCVFYTILNPVEGGKRCPFCAGPMSETGLVEKVDGLEIVKYEHGKEVSREPRRAFRRIF